MAFSMVHGNEHRLLSRHVDNQLVKHQPFPAAAAPVVVQSLFADLYAQPVIPTKDASARPKTIHHMLWPDHFLHLHTNEHLV